MTDQPRVQCSAAGLFRDRHMATDRQYHVTAPDGQQFVFCSACCLLEYAIYGLPADLPEVDACHAVTDTGSEAAA